ncbi:DUF3168 domain-containing protein [Paraburkholderia aspalathi]|nr:DUF3168 domain-containing protein [Paraburkholderia aspalathi]
MTSPTLELQQALFSRLTTNAALIALIGDRVYDWVPENPTYPYVSFGPMDETSADADCVDAFEISMQLDVWSRSVGYEEARQVADVIRRALKADLSLTENALVYLVHRQTRVFRDPDGLTSHAALTFEAVAEQP